VTTGCAVSHNIQIYSYTDNRILHLNTINVLRTSLWTIFIHKKFIYWVKVKGVIGGWSGSRAGLDVSEKRKWVKQFKNSSLTPTQPYENSRRAKTSREESLVPAYIDKRNLAVLILLASDGPFVLTISFNCLHDFTSALRLCCTAKHVASPRVVNDACGQSTECWLIRAIDTLGDKPIQIPFHPPQTPTDSPRFEHKGLCRGTPVSNRPYSANSCCRFSVLRANEQIP
jgi:hypothetical protein